MAQIGAIVWLIVIILTLTAVLAKDTLELSTDRRVSRQTTIYSMFCCKMEVIGH
mgnify:CR=1 FL=1